MVVSYKAFNGTILNPRGFYLVFKQMVGDEHSGAGFQGSGYACFCY